MCRGKGEKENEGQKVVSKDATKHELVESCELCGTEAQLYCQADDAFLCRKCDEWVHGANFLAQRHIRCLFCSSCRCLTQRYLIGNSLEVVLPSIVSNGPKNQCNSGSSAEGDCSGEEIKMPFLFL